MNASEELRWEAVLERRVDPSFVFGVQTTRVACRPGCPSRTPARKNVRFFDDFPAAQRAGFRACKRCVPQEPVAGAQRVRLVERACEAFARDGAPSIGEVAGALGLSRYYFQRIFRLITGVTPGDYRRALRDERFRALLASGARVTDAIQDAGFGSASRAYDARSLGMAPSSFRDGARGERIVYTIAGSSLGRVLVATTERGIAAIELADCDDDAFAALQLHFPHAELERDDAVLRAAVNEVVALVDDSGATVALELDIRGTAFQRRIWNALRNVPPGERVSYEALAAAAGCPRAAQAVGTACAANRHAVAIPCHRAVRKDGELAGYRWGLHRKRALLEREAERRTS